MWQLVLANISIKRWVIDSNQHSLSDCYSHALVIPANNAEIVQGHFMTSGLKLVIDWWWWPQVFPESFSKCSAWLPYIFILAVHPATLVPIYYPTFLQNMNSNTNKNRKSHSNTSSRKPYIVVPYMKGLSESCKNICRRHGIGMHFKGANTIRQLLVHPKDKDMHPLYVVYPYIWDEVLFNIPELKLK